MTGWQPIETAPKDGRDLWLWREDAGCFLGRWVAPCDFMVGEELIQYKGDDAFEEDWFGADYVAGFRVSNDGLPTKWHELPGPPDGESK